jgi:uncharacterized Rmd1/YagE family protein
MSNQTCQSNVPIILCVCRFCCRFMPSWCPPSWPSQLPSRRIEVQLEPILDTIESKLDRLEKGRLGLGNRELARTIARVVRHEYNTIAYIMILDKPDITWTSSDAADFYEKMADFFELTDRYEVIKHKTAILERILDGFMSISHSIRGFSSSG